jgi:hypothetical protein
MAESARWIEAVMLGEIALGVGGRSEPAGPPIEAGCTRRAVMQ